MITLGAMGTLGLSVAAIGLQPGAERAPRRSLTSLEVRTFSILASVADQVCPATESLPSAWDLEVPEDIDAFLGLADPELGRQVSQALRVFDSPLVGLGLDGELRKPFTACTSTQQQEILRAFGRSQLGLRRTVYKALVSLISATYWGNPRTYAASGFRPIRYGTP